jgi:uncharacterized RDD family membrane protein YckC
MATNDKIFKSTNRPTSYQMVQKKTSQSKQKNRRTASKETTQTARSKPVLSKKKNEQAKQQSEPELIDPNKITLNEQTKNENTSKKGMVPQVILKPASILTRTLAFIFDILLIDLVIFSWFRPYFFNMLPTTGTWSELLSTAQTETVISPQLSGLIAIMALLMMAYFVFFEFVFSQTPGKLLFRLKTISAAQLFKDLKKQRHSLEDIKEKVIKSQDTVDIHKEMQNQQPQQTKRNGTGQIQFSLTFWQALIRWIIFIPLFPFTILIFVDPIYLILRKRRLTEMLSKTTVVEVVPGQSPLAQRLMRQMQQFRNNK